jgi:hypothetical protein
MKSTFIIRWIMTFTSIECLCGIQTTSFVCSIFYKQIKLIKKWSNLTNRISPGGWKPVGTIPFVVIINSPCWVCKFSLRKIETYDRQKWFAFFSNKSLTRIWTSWKKKRTVSRISNHSASFNRSYFYPNNSFITKQSIKILTLLNAINALSNRSSTVELRTNFRIEFTWLYVTFIKSDAHGQSIIWNLTDIVIRSYN